MTLAKVFLITLWVWHPHVGWLDGMRFEDKSTCEATWEDYVASYPEKTNTPHACQILEPDQPPSG